MRVFFPPPLRGRAALGILAVRSIVGLGFIFHGLMKIAHPTAWMGPHGFAPHWLQGVVTCAEILGGSALILGFLTPIVAILLGIDMLTAIFGFHIPAGGHFVGGRAAFEVPLVYLIVVIALLLAGPGEYSIDAHLFK